MVTHKTVEQEKQQVVVEQLWIERWQVELAELQVAIWKRDILRKVVN
jgi:hypothetical protein